MELVKVTEGQDGQVVSARELHEFLEVGQDFTNWCKRMFSYGFEVNVDFLLAKSSEQTSRGGHNKIDYALTLDAAKEISMLQRSEKGKQARKYFIKCEKKLQEQPKVPQTFEQALEKLLESVREQERLSQEVESKSKEVETKNKELSLQAPKVKVYDAFQGVTNSIKIGDFAQQLCSDLINIGRDRLFEWLREKKYLKTVKAKKQTNLPYQKYLDDGYFNVKPRVISVSEYGLISTSTTYITAKGRLRITDKLLQDGRFETTADKGLKIQFTEEQEQELLRLKDEEDDFYRDDQQLD